MKKFLLLLFLILVCSFALCACSSGEEKGYFTVFSSHGEFGTATPGVTLPQGVGIYSYDVENDVFVTYRTALNAFTNKSVTLFGLCGYDKVYLEPTYVEITAIRGDVAIVQKYQTYESSQLTTVGVVKFRGGNEGELNRFSPNDSSATLFRFVGDYVVTLGEKDLASSEANYSTFYDYSQGVLLEAFRLRCGSKYTFQAFDDYVVAVEKDHAFFYERRNNVNGYLIPYAPSGEDATHYGYYVPYPEDTEGEFSDYMKIDVFYLGNGWFSRTAQLRDEQPFEGYRIVYEEIDGSIFSKETKTYYANVRCDFYNARTHETRSNDWIIVHAVANRYYTDYYAQLGGYLNNASSYSQELSAYEYHLPYLDPAQSIKDGYSILYYYYLPYAEEENYYAETSFCVVSDKLVFDRLASADILMPPVFLDGKGIPTSDPIYEPYFGSVYVYDTDLDRTEVLPYREGRRTYQSFLYHGGGIVAQELNYDLTTGYYGIVAPDGSQLVDFSYDALTPFFGEYAVGYRGKAFVRIKKDGSTTAISDVVNVRQGVYVFTDRGQLGLKNYAGEELLPAEYEELEVVESVMTRGKFLTSYASAKKDGAVTVYRLE